MHTVYVRYTAGGWTQSHEIMPQSCKYAVRACNDPAADNFVSAWVQASITDWFPTDGAGNPGSISTYSPSASMCQYGGCNDTDATNYNSQACAIAGPASSHCHAGAPNHLDGLSPKAVAITQLFRLVGEASFVTHKASLPNPPCPSAGHL